MSELNADIARLLGWTDIHRETFLGRGGFVGLEPKTGLEYVPIPYYSGDHGAALGLLEYILSIRDKQGLLPLYESDIRQYFSKEWYVVIGMWQQTESKEFKVKAETLPLAIALACHSVLKSLTKPEATSR